MEGISQDKIAEAKKKLREVLTLEKVRELLKDRNFTKERYQEYLSNIERFVFPNGIFYNKQKERVQTIRINPIFASIVELARVLKGVKNGDPTIFDRISALVTPAGLPSRSFELMANKSFQNQRF